MPFLRSASLLALATSAVLTADRLHPGRAFCPLEAACEKARESALGSLGGVPTSSIGMVAFGGLFLLTLLPLSMSRRLLRPAGVVAGLTGAALVLYQAFVIGSFCPLCLVADAAGLACAGAVLGWRPVPVRLSGRSLPGEPLVHQLRWVFAAAVVVALPFAWPRDERPSWVPLAAANPLLADLGPLPGATATTANAAEPDGTSPSTPDSSAIPESGTPPAPAEALPPIPRLARDARGRVMLPPPAAATATPLLATAVPSTGRPAGSRPEESPPWATLTPRLTNPGGDATSAPPPSRAAPRPPPAPPSSPMPAPAPVAAARPVVGIVEYLNAFCPHCRVTHRRLARVLTTLDVAARVRRIYTWPSEAVPAWARACAHAQTLGLEDRFFEELILAEREDLGEILSAGRRAGLDVASLRAAIAADGLAPRLERDRRIAGSAGLEGLPTLDIGRRRLLGEQSEGELREAVEAALALRRGAR